MQRRRDAAPGVRWIASMVVLALACAGCADEPGGDIPTTTAPPAAGQEAGGSTTTTREAAPAGAYRLDDAVPIDGTAPFALAGVDPGVATSATVIDWEAEGYEASEAPSGSTIDVTRCTQPYPGIIQYDTTWDAPAGTTFPTPVSVVLGVTMGDVGTGSVMDVEASATGQMRLLAPVPGAGGEGEEGVTLDRGPRTLEGADCWAAFATDQSIGSAAVVIEPPRAEQTAVVNAPVGTLERTIQEQQPSDAPLLPFQYAYAAGTRFYADVMYVPEVPTQLQRFEEHLEANHTCLRLEFVYDAVTVLQERGCGGFARDGVWTTGSVSFATGYGSGWNVLVSGPDATVVDVTLRSLTPLVVLSTRPIPIVPGGHVLVGWVRFEGEEILVTIGEQDCTGSCRSPEQFFYVHRIVDGAPVPYAYYPAYGYCLLAEEEPWTLAVIDDGAIEIERAGGIERIEGNGIDHMALALVPAGEASAVRIVDASGGEPRCLASLPDPRGGIVDPSDVPTATTTVPIDADITVVAEPCGYGPIDASFFSSEPAIATTCVKTPFETFGMGRYYPDGEQFTQGGDPVPGAECLVYWHGYREGGGPCIDTTDTFGWTGGRSASEGSEYAYAVGLVTDETISVVAVTDRGERIVGIPDERMVFLWWNPDAELISVTAETPSGSVDLLALEG